MRGKHKVIGVMSGTSLDGIDIAYCEFIQGKTGWKYKIIYASTYSYSEAWVKKLSKLSEGSALDLIRIDNELGQLIGNNVKIFIKNFGLEVDFISSHGHTIFHEPAKGITTQIGNGAIIAAINQMPVVCDFRRLDVALGGQGAPLVPFGDEILFNQYGAIINIGGFANISYKDNGERIAFDICPANIVLNEFAQLKDQSFDFNGQLARVGNLSKELFDKLNTLKYYKQSPPKSLGKEWVQSQITPLIQKFNLSSEDFLCTFCEHIATQIKKSIPSKLTSKVLITGGGAFNLYLMERIQSIGFDFVVPENTLVEYKEALIFAFLGLLRFRNEINCLSSTTGATFNSIGGAIYNGNIERVDLLSFS